MKFPWMREDSWFAACCHGGSDPEPASVPTQTTTQNISEPWSEQRPFLTQGFQAAQQDILNRPLEYFPDSTVVPFAGQTQQALQQQEQRALSGNPLLGQAQQQVGQTLAGDYLTNPAFDQLSQSVAAQVLPGVDTGFALGNRFGSPLHAQAVAQGISRELAPFAFQDYRVGRAEQQAAAQQAPGLAQQDYFDIGQLRGVGAEREAQSGRELQDRLSRFQFEQTEPYGRLAAYMGLIGGGYGGQTTSTGDVLVPQQAGANPLLTGLGAAGTTAGIAGNLFGPFGVFS